MNISKPLNDSQVHLLAKFKFPLHFWKIFSQCIYVHNKSEQNWQLIKGVDDTNAAAAVNDTAVADDICTQPSAATQQHI